MSHRQNRGFHAILRSAWKNRRLDEGPNARAVSAVNDFPEVWNALFNVQRLGAQDLSGRTHDDPQEQFVDVDPSPRDVPAFRMRAPGDELRPGSEVESPTLPLPPPRNADELERLLHAVASTPSGERQLIIDTVAAFTERDAVADLLHHALLELPAADISRHLMLLALIGELRHESSIPVLERFVWLPDEAVLRPDSHNGPTSADSGAASHFMTGGAPQARAAEMLIWVTRGDYHEGVRRILGEHPAVEVRVATIDACAYAADDDPQALRSLRVREEDRWAVGLPRRTADVDPHEFDALVERRLAEIGSPPELPQRQERDDDEESDVR